MVLTNHFRIIHFGWSWHHYCPDFANVGWQEYTVYHKREQQVISSRFIYVLHAKYVICMPFNALCSWSISKEHQAPMNYCMYSTHSPTSCGLYIFTPFSVRFIIKSFNINIILKYFNLSYIDTYIAHCLSSFFLGSHVYVHSTYWHEKVATSSFLQIMSRLHYHTKIFVKPHLRFTNITWDISKNLELSKLKLRTFGFHSCTWQLNNLQQYTEGPRLTRILGLEKKTHYAKFSLVGL